MEVCVDEGASPGLAQMVAGVVGPALERDPKRASRIKGSLALKATDHDAGVTLRFEPARVVVAGAAETGALVTIAAPLMTLGALGQGGHAVGALWRREARVKGGLRHPLLLWRVRRLLK